MIPTILAVELTTSEIVVAIIVAVLGSGVLATLITVLAMRKKTNADTRATDTKTMTDLGHKFVELVNDFAVAKSDATSAEERHSLEKIASKEELSRLSDQVEKCEQEHLEWAEKENDWNQCKSAMLQFLIKAEPELQALTSQPTLLLAVAELRSRVEST